MMTVGVATLAVVVMEGVLGVVVIVVEVWLEMNVVVEVALMSAVSLGISVGGLLSSN